MLGIIGINWWAIAVVWLLYMAVGAFWYSPAGFAPAWKKYTGIDIMAIPTYKATHILVAVAISCLVQVLTLAIIVNSIGATTFISGLFTGLVLWFGLTAATTVGGTLYSLRNWKFFWLNAGYF